jgi:hypothetical protein
MWSTPPDQDESFNPGSSQQTCDKNSRGENDKDGIFRDTNHSSRHLTNRDDPQPIIGTVPTSSPVDYREAESIIGLARKVTMSLLIQVP